MRLIDADALLTERKKSKYYHLPNGDIAIPIIDVEHAPTVKPKPQWIPCSERLPELDEDGYSDKVLVCFSNFSGCEVCEYRECDDCHGWYVVDSDDNPEDVGVHVIAWMPLPEPYREDSE